MRQIELLRYRMLYATHAYAVIPLKLFADTFFHYFLINIEFLIKQRGLTKCECSHRNPFKNISYNTPFMVVLFVCA